MAVWDDNPSDTLQKYIDNFLKFVQTNIDITYGGNNDNSEQPLNYNNIPIAFQGTCIRSVTNEDISGDIFGGRVGQCYIKYDLTIGDNSEFISNVKFLGISGFVYDNTDGSQYRQLWDDSNNILYSCSIKSELLNGRLYIPNSADNNNSFWKQYYINYNDFDYANICDSELSCYNSYTANQLYLCPWNVDYNVVTDNSGYQYVTVDSHGNSIPNHSELQYHMATTNSPSFLFTDYNSIVNNYVTYGGNTYNDNDTYNNVINTYYGDNYLVLAPVGVGVNGELGFNFDDLVGALEIAIGDINSHMGYNVVVPSYDELKYEDMGSFYITPIKQIDTLPVAPDIADTVIDVSEPLGILSTGFGALLDSFNNIGVTLTLTFTFLSCLIINKLRGD